LPKPAVNTTIVMDAEVEVCVEEGTLLNNNHRCKTQTQELEVALVINPRCNLKQQQEEIQLLKLKCKASHLMA
jgi:hypothetical protein